MNSAAGPDALAAIAGRLPTLEGERVIATYGALFRSIATMGCAVWVFLMGSALPMVGDTRLGIIGFVCGILAASIICLLSAALPSFRYGIDSIDASKSFLGVRGSMLTLIGLLLSALGWAAVILSMIARGIASLLAQWSQTNAAADERVIIVLGFSIIGLTWMLLRSGFRFVQRMNDFVGPALMGLAVLSLFLLARRYGIHHLWVTSVPAAAALTTDRRMSMAYAFEFGLTMQLVAWPYIGGLYRLVARRKDAVGPLLAGTLFSGGFCSIVAALAAVSAGSADPIVWIVNLAGRETGTALVCLILVLNVPVLCMLLYFAGVAVQQARSLARIHWPSLVALILLPLIVATLNTGWVLAHIITLSTYGGLMFLGISVIAIVDYYVLRGQSIELEQVFACGERGRYWFWGGVNWIAVVVLVSGVAAYLSLYDPITLSARAEFRYFGAAVPVLVLSAVAYYALMRLIVVPGGRGGYRKEGGTVSVPTEPVDVSL
jgi:nucleobase:cation symporter-1, NCS1 family